MPDNDRRYNRPLRGVRLENFLSFGPVSTTLELEDLNVLIGPNASGKSNFIEALALMRSTPVSAAASSSDLGGVIRRGGGAGQWIWRGGSVGTVELLASPKDGQPLRHILSFRGDEPAFRLEDERIEDAFPTSGQQEPYRYYALKHGDSGIKVAPGSRPAFDVVRDFSIGSNPTGAWSYGFSNTLGEFAPHSTRQLEVFPGVDRWTTPEIDDLGVMRNRTNVNVTGNPATYTIPPDMLLMHPGKDGSFEVIRWTCERDGQYAIEGSFKGLDTQTGIADISVYIVTHLQNSQPLITRLVDLHGIGTEVPFSITKLQMRRGDRIDFVVGVGPSRQYGAGSTGLQAVITQAAESISNRLSILSQRRDPERYPEITYLAEVYENLRIYREWSFGRNAIVRVPQPSDMRNDRLEEDFSNLGLVLSRLRKRPAVKAAITQALKDLYEGVTDFEIIVDGGTVQVFFSEGDYSIPATRLSDGTLRYLCLLAILCDPSPPPLVCIEEPELGLHPDIIPKVADLLVAASARTQLIVTTHSDVLVDALSDTPEAVVVCEKHDGHTEMRRLRKDELSAWLEQYRLGQLWIKGEIGGTRW